MEGALGTPGTTESGGVQGAPPIQEKTEPASLGQGHGGPPELQRRRGCRAAPHVKIRPGVERATIEAARILCAEHARPWRLDDLARRVGSNRTDLEAGFRALFGWSAHGYLTLQRVREARRLLQNEALTIEEVGREVGYRSRPAFCLIFQRLTGMTPGAYRRRLTFVPANARVIELLISNRGC